MKYIVMLYRVYLLTLTGSDGTGASGGDDDDDDLRTLDERSE